MADFNADDFLNQQTDQAMQDHFIPIPEGEYRATVGDGPEDIKIESFPGKKDPTKTFYRLSLNWIIHDDNLKAQLERETLRVRDQFLIDIENGKLATGSEKNINLGNRRTALGLNTPGMPFSLNLLRGKGPALIRVYQEPDEKDPKIKYSRVSRAAPLSL